MNKKEKGRRIYVKSTPEHEEELRQLREQIEAEKPEIIARGRELKRRREESLAKLRDVFRALRAVRQAQGLSLSDMQARTGMSRETISKLENIRGTNPTVDTIERYAEALGQRVVLTLEPIA